MDFDYTIITNNYSIFISGLWITLWIVTFSFLSGSIFGLILCIASLRDSGIFFRAARVYVDFFRTTPEMVLIFWAYFCLPPILGLKMSSIVAGTLALSLVSAAFLAEIFRAGIRAVPKEQFEAGKALAIPTFRLWQKVILPQAVRRMMPAFINYLTEILKNSALLSAIGVHELAFEAYSLGARTFRYVEALTLIAVVYFMIIFPISIYARRIEAKLALKTGN